MEKPFIYPYLGSSSWGEAWESSLFRRKAIGGAILFTAVLLACPYFFASIEARPGVVLNDRLLQWIPARDFSLTIFIFVWSATLLIIVRSVQQPAIFLKTIYLLIVINLLRIVAITLFPLEPPIEIIHLKDPLTSLSYGGTKVIITKDLFFSGHASNLFMFYLCLQKKWDRQFALLATIVVGILVLVQHVHYCIDVVAAIIITYGLVKLTKRLSFLNL
ncbi:MAG: phosphatase PAP2-related protein [Ferruginibacter sp.]